MTERDFIIRNLKIKQRAVFDMADLYKVMFRWFSRNNYDFQEKEYFEKAMGDGSEKHLEIAWLAYRKVSDYFKFRINIKFLIIGLKSTEIEVGDIKRKTNEGDLEMRFDAILERDYEGRFESNAVTKFFRDLYDKLIIRSRIEEYETQIHEETYELIGEIKAFLNLFKFQEIKPE